MSAATTFLALGDSLISDRFAGAHRGAASLLFRNSDRHYPEFRGADLVGLGPVILQNLSQPGTTLHQVQRWLERWHSPYPPEWIVLSVGAQDLLSANFDPESYLVGYREVLRRMRHRFPQAHLAVLNVCDPSDGLGDFPGDRLFEKAPRHRFCGLLEWLNPCIARLAGADLIDVHAHFRGHGSGHTEAGSAAHGCWFERGLLPNAQGASEIRRLILKRWGFIPSRPMLAV